MPVQHMALALSFHVRSSWFIVLFFYFLVNFLSSFIHFWKWSIAVFQLLLTCVFLLLFLSVLLHVFQGSVIRNIYVYIFCILLMDWPFNCHKIFLFTSRSSLIIVYPLQFFYGCCLVSFSICLLSSSLCLTLVGLRSFLI